MNLKIGCHVSIADGLLGAAREAHGYGGNTFMVYTGAPQNTVRKPVEKLKIDEGKAFMREHGMDEFVVHAPYIINLASCKDDTYGLAVRFLKEELKRTAAFGSELFVVHPGMYVGASFDYGVKRIADGLNAAADESRGIFICLEVMAGKGTEIGRSFEELRMIIDLVEDSDRIGVCFDTCHTHDAGYDIVNNFEGVMKEFDAVLGLERLKVFHLNGSLNPRGAKKDRHANIGSNGEGTRGADHIGFDALYRIVHSKYAEGRPIILETPWIEDNTRNLYREEIEMLRTTGGGRPYKEGV